MIQVELQETFGSDASIANAAWTSSYDKDTREEKYDDPEKVASLVPKLIASGHGTPIESVVFRFWIRMPIYIDREHMTHRIASHNGLSGRYRTMPDDFYAVPNDVKEILDRTTESGAGYTAWAVSRYDSLCEQANAFYRAVLNDTKESVAEGRITNAEYKRIRETIRGCLPIANMVERTTIMNLRSFANYYRLRSHPEAAKEIQIIANKMLTAVEAANVCPVALAALKEARWRV